MNKLQWIAVMSGVLGLVMVAMLPARASGPEAAASTDDATDPLHQGKAAYARTCAACHGPKAEGAKGPPLVPFVYLEAQVMAIVRGGQGEMPPMPVQAISDDEVFATMAYLMALEDAQQ